MNTTSVKAGIVGCAAPERDQETVTSLASAHNNVYSQPMWERRLLCLQSQLGRGRAFWFSWDGHGGQRAFCFGSEPVCTEKWQIRQHDDPQIVQHSGNEEIRACESWTSTKARQDKEMPTTEPDRTSPAEVQGTIRPTFTSVSCPFWSALDVSTGPHIRWRPENGSILFHPERSR